MRWIILIFSLIAFSHIVVMAQEGGLGFIYDYSVFPVPDGSGDCYLEIYFGIPCNQLTFEKVEGSLEANLLLGVRLLDEDGNVVLEDIEGVKKSVSSLEEAESERLILEQLTYRIEGGYYRGELGVTDVLSKTTGTSIMEIEEIKDIGDGIIYDLQLASNIYTSEDEQSIFFKNGFIVLPNPSRIYREPVNIPLYFEVNHFGDGEKVVEYIIADAAGEKKWAMERRYSVSGHSILVDTLKVGEIGVGYYQLIVRIEGVEKRKTFVVYSEEYEAEIALLLQSKSLKPYTEEESARIRKEISIIADKEEIELYDSLPLELRPYFVERFWKRRDPTPETQFNELKEAFYERLEYVNEKFSISNKEGWQTDMGRVYLKYGEPDEISSQPMGLSSMVGIDVSTFETEPTEAWEYHSGGEFHTGAIFIFVDYDNDGEYNFFGSTEPGYGRLLKIGGGESGY